MRKSICNPAHGALFFTLNPGSGLNKTVCMHLFVLQTGNFYHSNYLIKKNHYMISLTSLSVFIAAQFAFKNYVLCKQWFK